MEEDHTYPSAFEEIVDNVLQININSIIDKPTGDWTSAQLVRGPMRSLRDVDPGIPIRPSSNVSNRIITETKLGSTRMSRSSIQVILRHTPFATYEFQGGRAIVMTTQIEQYSRPDSFPLIRRDILATRFIHALSRSRSLNIYTHGKADEQAAESISRHIKTVRPDAVTVKPFPEVYRCRTCGHIYKIDVSNGTTNCPRTTCRGEGTQIRHVNIHNCGNIESLNIPECRRHKRAWIKLDSYAQEPSKWAFKCGICNSTIRTGTFSKCSRCGSLPEKERRMLTVVHNKTSAYFPVTQSFVNLKSGTDLDLVIKDPASFIASHLSSDGLEVIDQKRLSYIRGIYEKFLLQGWPESQAKNAIEIGTLTPSEKNTNILELLDTSGKTPDCSNDSLSISDFFPNKLSMKESALDIFEAINAVENTSHILLSGHRGKNSLEFAAAQELAMNLGIKDIVYVENLPMAVANAGYQRLSDQGGSRWDAPVSIYPPEDDTRYPVYTETYETEAYVIFLDKERVSNFIRHWIGISHDAMNDSSLEIKIAAGAGAHHFGDNLRACDGRIRSANKPIDPIGHFTFLLLHTLSHATLEASSILSGYHPASLSEHLLPGALAFIVYANKRSTFSIGGLQAVFQHNPCRLVRRISEAARDCQHDPSCMNGTDAACVACVYLPDTSCREMNSHLSRKILYGDRSIGKKGYFNFGTT